MEQYRVTFKDYEHITTDEWEADRMFRTWAQRATEDEPASIYVPDYDTGLWRLDSTTA